MFTSEGITKIIEYGTAKFEKNWLTTIEKTEFILRTLSFSILISTLGYIQTLMRNLFV
jgi:hypothetical protein